MKDKIVKKIRKLFALSKSSNEAEAKEAYKKAMELMVKFNIDCIEHEKEFLKKEKAFRRESVEIKYISQVIVECFLVKMLKQRKFCPANRKSLTFYTFIGDETNVQLALFAFDFLLLRYKELWRVVQKEKNLALREKESYYLGLSHGFIQKHKEIVNYSKNKYGLVVVKNPKLDEFVKEEYGTLKDSKPDMSKADKFDLLLRGEMDGENININQGIENNYDSLKAIGI